MHPFVLIWGGGDLASGVALRLHRAGLRVLIVERPQPLTVRRTVAFSEAVWNGCITIEAVIGRLVKSSQELDAVWLADEVPVVVDPNLTLLAEAKPLVLVDARMRKKEADTKLSMAELVIGLGPGFTVGRNCHAAIETNRGHFLGRVYWQGSPEADTGIPGQVADYRSARVLHAPCAGEVETLVKIGSIITEGDPILSVGDEVVCAPFTGLLRGLIHDGVAVRKGAKVGDVDPRPEKFRCEYVSEKSLAIGGGVLEAVLTVPEVRNRLWCSAS